MKKCKYLITDYSSVFFDVAYMKKNIIFYQFDNIKFQLEHYNKGYLNYNDFDNFKYCCRKSNVKILDIEYLNNIRCKIEATNGEKEELIRYVNKNEIKIMNFTILQNKKIRKNIEI